MHHEERPEINQTTKIWTHSNMELKMKLQYHRHLPQYTRQLVEEYATATDAGSELHYVSLGGQGVAFNRDAPRLQGDMLRPSFCNVSAISVFARWLWR